MTGQQPPVSQAWLDQGETREAASYALPPATALEVAAVLTGDLHDPAAKEVLASYFAPGAEPRYDTPQAAAEAEAQA